jgi:glucose-1-phosphate thymidylyltransferase
MCLEEIGLELGYLTADQVVARADVLGRNDYALYLRRRASEFAGQRTPALQYVSGSK